MTRNITLKAMKLALLAITAVTGCTASKPVTPMNTGVVTVERYVPVAPGAVEYVWEPPMVDVVDVPPGLDPEGEYYRPGHQTIVEIRQGRWQYYKNRDSK